MNLLVRSIIVPPGSELLVKGTQPRSGEIMVDQARLIESISVLLQASIDENLWDARGQLVITIKRAHQQSEH